MRRLIFITSFVFAVLPFSASAIQPSVGEIKDTRTTGQFFAGLEVELKLVGDEVADVKGVRTVIEKAVDSTGRDLIDPEKMKGEFEEFNQHSWAPSSARLNLKNPARKAETLAALEGSFELYIPKSDPDSIVSVPNFMKSTGKPVQSPALKAAGIELTVMDKASYDALRAEKEKQAREKAEAEGMAGAMAGAFGAMFGFMGVNENDLVFQIRDPNKKLIGYKVLDGSGKEINHIGSMATEEMKIVNFSSKVGEDATLQISVSTPKSVQVAKFSFNNIALP